MAGMRIDLLRHWAIFVAVAEEQHFGTAADRLGMSQPAVSQGLRRLEGHLDLRLIDRGGRAVAITAEGRRVLPLARTLLRDADHLAAAAGRLTASSLILDFGVAAALPTALLTAAVSGLAAGDSRVEVRRAACPVIVDAVGAGELVCGLVEDPTPYADLARGKLHEFPRALLVPSGSPALERSRIDWSALSRQELVMLPRADNPAAHDRLVDLVGERVLASRVAEVERPSDIAGVVAGVGGFALVDVPLAQQSGLSWRVLPRQFDGRCRVVVHPDRQVDEARRDLRAVVDAALSAASRAQGGAQPDSERRS